MTGGVCWFVQSHRDPEQVLRLARVLRRGSAGPIVVQHDFRGCRLEWEPFAALGGCHLLPVSVPKERGRFSLLLQPWLDFMAWSERERLAWEWLVVLSAQDYPVMPVARIESELLATDRDGFLRHWDVLSSASPWSRRKARVRYWYRYRRLPAWSAGALAALRGLCKFAPLHFYLDYGPWVGVRVPRAPFGEGFRCYGGWAWWTLRRRALVYVQEFLAQHPEIERHYRGTIAPEESLIQTVLINSGRFALPDDDRRYIDYARAHRGSPRTLTVADLPQLGGERFHFARKFDAGIDRQVLDRIDRELLLG